MAIESFYFESRGIDRWHGPILVAIPVRAGDTVQMHLVEVSGKNSLTNLITPWHMYGPQNLLWAYLAEKRIWRLHILTVPYSALSSLPLHVQLDIVIVLTPKPVLARGEALWGDCQRGVSTGAVGVFFVPDHLFYHFDAFLALLWQWREKASFLSALSGLTDDGVFFYDPKYVSELQLPLDEPPKENSIRPDDYWHAKPTKTDTDDFRITDFLNKLNRPEDFTGGVGDRDDRQHPPIIWHGPEKEGNDFSLEFPEEAVQSPDFVENVVNELKVEEELQIKPTTVALAAEPRYLQAIINELGQDKKSVKDRLILETFYTANVFIGPYDTEALAAVAPFPDQEVFNDPDAIAEQLTILFQTNMDESDEPQKAILHLPRVGGSSSVNFGFKTLREGEFLANILAYHKGRLIQHILLSATVQDRNSIRPCSPIRLQVKAELRSQLGDLAGRTEAKFSAVYDDWIGHQVIGLAKGEPFRYTGNSGVIRMLSDIRAILQTAALDLESYPANLYDVNVMHLLRTLAYKGSELFSYLGKPDPGEVVQVLSNSLEFMPFDFVYSYQIPDQNAAVCANAVVALKKGGCCQHTMISAIPGKCICPFGFWGISKMIERHQYDPKRPFAERQECISVEPVQGRNCLHIFRSSLYASTKRMETKLTSGLRQQIATSIRNAAVQLKGVAHEAEGWDSWRESLAQNAHDLLILAVHIEKNNDRINTIEIGEESLLQPFLIEHVQQHHKSPPPLVCIIGCESADIEEQGFDVSHQLMFNGVAAVICNFTKIRGSQAGKIITRFVDILAAHGGEDFLLGAIIQKLRQSLLAEGIVVAMSVYALGDADWILKIGKKDV